MGTDRRKAQERTMVCLHGTAFYSKNPTPPGAALSKIPRGHKNGVGEDEVTVTSGLHAQTEGGLCPKLECAG